MVKQPPICGINMELNRIPEQKTCALLCAYKLEVDENPFFSI
jgi:hypothetical protein